MANANEVELAHQLATAAAQHLIERGLSAPDGASRDIELLAAQIVETINFLATSRSSSPTQLKLHLAGHLARSTGLSAGPSLGCVTAVGLLALPFGQVLLIPSGIVKAVFLLKDMYDTDKACGFSASAQRQAARAVAPIAIWLDKGVREALMRQIPWAPLGGR